MTGGGTVGAAPDGWLGGEADAPAIHDPVAGASLSYRALRERVETVAGQLVRLGVEPGDAVAYTLPNGPEAIVMFLAVAASGGAAAPLNPLYERDEVARYLTDIEPRIVVVHGAVSDATAGAASDRAVDVATLTGTADRLQLEPGGTGRPGALPDADPEQVVLLLHTSGTTGRAKVVPLRRRNLGASAAAVARHYELTPSDVSHCVMPLFHVHGIVASTLAPLTVGGSVIAPRRFSAGAFWDTGLRFGATWFSAVPTIHQILLARGDDDAARAGVLRFARSCSAPLAPSVMEAFESRFEVPLIEAYGMTEAAHQMTSNPVPPGARKPGSVGVSAGADVRIVDDAWAFLPSGSVGEVVVHGRGVVDGYLRNPEADAVSFREGWFRTGDSGTIDGDGYLHLKGRIKELINRGGEKISPQEVEGALLRHASVAEAAVYALPDPTYGEVVAAVVVLRDDVGEAALQAHCAELLAPFKVPTRIAVLDEIPKGPTGKVQRLLLAYRASGT